MIFDMPFADRHIPSAADLMCERCGYTLTGLPETGNCPECGTPVEQSLGRDRNPPLWETSSSEQRPRAFVITTAAVLLTPSRFFRTLATRATSPLAGQFARTHMLLASLLLGIGLTIHGHWMAFSRIFSTTAGIELMLMGPLLIVLVYGSLRLVTRVAERLTAIEARYWGFRLPADVVRRCLCYHAACYLPVGLAALTLTAGYRLLVLQGTLDGSHGVQYLYALSALVILSAGYLFRTYWLAMRHAMRANR